MTATKQEVEGQQPDTSPSGTKKQASGSSRNRKPAAPRAQAKPATAKSTVKASTSSSSQIRNAASDSSKLKENALRAEALEHENVAVQNKKAADFNTSTTDVSGVIVPSDRGDIKETEQARPTVLEQQEKQAHKNQSHKQHIKDKKAHLLIGDIEKNQDTSGASVDPNKHLEILQKKALKSEKKVKKLKKKVHKAEKKEVKTSKIRALKEKLTKAFSKWQRRKKKLEAGSIGKTVEG